MNVYESDATRWLMQCVRRDQPKLLTTSRNLPITIVELGGTIQVLLGRPGEDVSSEDLKAALPTYHAWGRLVAEFLGSDGIGVIAQRSRWRQRITSRQTTYNCLAHELNARAAELVRQDRVAEEGTADCNEIFAGVSRRILALDAQNLSDAGLLAATRRILAIANDGQYEAWERRMELGNQQLAAREEFRLMLQAGRYKPDDVDPLFAQAARRLRNGEAPFEEDEPFTRERIIDCLRAERKGRQDKQRRLHVKQRTQPLEKAA
jgi:hypothetical protein